MKRVSVQKSGWNFQAGLLGPFWYIFRGMVEKGIILLLISICTLGVGIIPIWIYCAYSGNKDFYLFLKKRGMYIFN